MTTLCAVINIANRVLYLCGMKKNIANSCHHITIVEVQQNGHHIAIGNPPSSSNGPTLYKVVTTLLCHLQGC